MLTITRKDMLLTINDNVIPAMGSSDVPVKFINDTETYVDFLIEPRVGYYVNGCPKSTVCEYDTSSNTIKIPAEAFKNKGILVIAIALIDNEDSNHIEVTKELALEVTPAPNGTVVLPATETWQTAVGNLVEQLYNQDYKPQFDQIEEDLSGLVEEAQNQQNKANNQQTQIDNAIDIMGDYEIVQDNPTQIRFKKGDGTYGDTVNLGDNLASKSMVNAGYDTSSGNSYSGSASDYGIEIGKASGNYEQVTTNGYQLFDASKMPNKSQGGVTVTNNHDGSFTISGNGNITTSNYDLRMDLTHEETIKLLKAGTLKCNFEIVSEPCFYILIVNKNGVIKEINGITTGLKTLDITQEYLNDDSFYLRYGFYGTLNKPIKSGTIKPMVYQDGDGTWEPFTGGEPSPNPDYAQEPKFFEPKNVYSVGKNLFNPQEQRKSRPDTSVQIDGDDITVTGLWYVDWKVKVEPNTDYTISFDCNGNYRQLVIFDKTGNYNFTKNLILQDNQILQGHNSKTFNTKDNELIYVLLYSGNGSQGTSIYSNVMINKGTTEQPYMPYSGQSTTPLDITLRALPNSVCDTYEDRVITRRVGVVEFDGSEDEGWGYQSDVNIFSTLIGGVGVMNRGCLCDKIQYAPVGNNPQWLAYLCCGFNPSAKYSSYFYIKAVDEFNLSLDDFKTYLQSNPITVWYELAEPTTERVDLPVIPSYFPFTNAWHDSEVEANDLTWHVLTAVNGKSSIRDGLGALLKDAPMTPNDNLLINSDFRYGVINQKGQTSYSGVVGRSIYGIDMWMIADNTSNKVDVHDGYATFTMADKSSINQYVYTIEENESYTFAIKLKNSKVKVIHLTPNNTTGTLLQDNIYVVLRNFTDDDNPNNDFQLYFANRSGSVKTLNIEYMKLEKGKYFTGMSVWNEAEELLKCMYLFEKKVINVMCSQFGATTCYANILYSIPKIKTPSITGKCTWVGSNTGAGIGETKITKLEATAIQKEYVDIKVTHESANFGQYSRNVFVELYIDAYNY